MIRPKLVHFTSIESDDYIHIRASMTYSRQAKFEFFEEIKKNFKDFVPTRPIQSLGLLTSNVFRMKVVGLDQEDNISFIKQFDSDAFGNFNFRILKPNDKSDLKLKIFETKTHSGLELLIGSFIPTKIKKPKKILITDFDKTLVDTRYSTIKELYLSLRNPIQYFPEVPSSMELVHNYIKKDFSPFVVSASPHFYENAIRDWLYKRQIFTGNIFLKDYRSIFSLFEGELSTKDLKSQGFYKFDTIVNILLMTGIPDELILIGDGFESDTLIYLTLAAILVDRYDPWMLWNNVKAQEAFKLNNQQNVRFLTKLNQLKHLRLSHKKPELKIYIRCKQHMIENLQTQVFKLEYANQLKHLVEYYVG